MDAFSWLGQGVEWLASFVPHYIHVKSTHRGVMFTRARSRVIEPGIHWYLPFWSEPVLYPVKRQTLNLPSQCINTMDGKTVLISVVVTYEIEDIHKALVDTFDFEDTVREISQGIVSRCVSSRDLEKLMGKSMRSLSRTIQARVGTALKSYGVRVLSAFVTDIGFVRILRLVGDSQDLTPV